MKKLNEKGFTIIELLIATVIFSVVLLLITTAIIQFGKLYYRSVIVSRTQETTRNIVSDISQVVQFSGESPSQFGSGSGHLCVGNRRYSFETDKQQKSNQKVLVADTLSSLCTATSGRVPNMNTSAPLDQGARELVGQDMQLLDFNVTNSGNLVNIQVRVGYGLTSDMNATQTGCKPLTIGGQFCAVSNIETTVTKRLKVN